MIDQSSEMGFVSLRVDHQKIERIGSTRGLIPVPLLDIGSSPSFFNVNWNKVRFDWKHVLQKELKGSFIQVDVFYEHPYFVLLPGIGVVKSDQYLNVLGYDLAPGDIRKSEVDDLSVLEYVFPQELQELIDEMTSSKINWHFLSQNLFQFSKQNIVSLPRVFVYYSSKYCYICVASVRGILLYNAYYVNDLEDILYYLLNSKNILELQEMEVIVLNEPTQLFDISAYLARFFHKVTHLEFEWLPTRNTFSDLVEL